MNKQLADEIVSLLYDNGIEASVYEDYSGRGMYGKTTTAIVTIDPNEAKEAATKILAEAENNEFGEEEDEGSSLFSTDNLGLSYVVY